MTNFFLIIEDLYWNILCLYNLKVHGAYGLSKVVERMPFCFLIKYLRKYGATVGEKCHFERGINIHRPLGKKPFENLIIGDNVYLGHKTLIDLTRRVTIKDKTIIASGCQIWTHASYYDFSFSNPVYREKCGQVEINEGAIIYSGTIISYGVSIGAFGKVGACSLVSRDVEFNSFVSGVPAKVVER
jgi:acetyltransferase-like isoleucine patch superfamily enzyme